MSEALRDLLGIYYDSTEKKIQEIPSCISFTIEGKVLGAQGGNLTYEWSAKCGEKIYKFNTRYNNIEILPVLNIFQEDFYVTLGQYGGAHTKEKFTGAISFAIDKDIKIVNERIDSFRTLDEMFIKYVSLCIQNNKFPANPTISVVVNRETNAEFRRMVYAERRHEAVGNRHSSNNSYNADYADLQKWFAGIIASGAQQHRWRKNRLEFNGLINRHIAQKSKDTVLFLIEYLYGKKITKAKSLHQIHIDLAGMDSNDFGIKDAQEMVKFVKTLESRYDSPYEQYKKLQEAGFKSKYPLKRWQKKVIDVYNKNMQTNTQEQKPN